jgi:hypothetical protein
VRVFDPGADDVQLPVLVSVLVLETGREFGLIGEWRPGVVLLEKLIRR